MRNAATQSGKELAREIALLKTQLDDLAHSASDAGDSVLGTVKRATNTLVEQTETRPLTTLAAVAGIGFLAGLLFRRH